MDYRTTEKLVPCPFNESHQILPHRMALHIIKCRKNYPDVEMRTCQYNATHIIPVADYDEHMTKCPDKGFTERATFYRQELEKKQPSNNRKREALNVQDIKSGEENWDSDIVAVASYNPTENILKREIIRPPPPGLGKAGRRQWRELDAERIKRIREGKPIDDLAFPIPNAADKTLSEGSGTVLSGNAYKEAGNNERKLNEDNNEDVIDKQFIKQKRKLEKRLHEISKLEEKEGNLSDQEKTKVDSRPDVEEQLEELLQMKT